MTNTIAKQRDRRSAAYDKPPSLSLDADTCDVMQSVGEAAYRWELDSDKLLWSSNAASLFCLEDETAIDSGRTFNNLLVATSPDNRNDAVLGSPGNDAGEGIAYRIQYALSGDKLSTKSDIWLEDNGRWFADDAGKAIRAQGVVRIVTDRRAREERISRLSRYDELTGLYNRNQLDYHLNEVLRESTQEQQSAAFLILSLDRFDLVNSIYGHDTGDLVMAEISKRLCTCLRQGDIIGRYGGAKIGLILRECSEKDMLIAGNRFLALIRDTATETDNGPVALSASIGGVIIPRHARTVGKAMAAAQQALEEAGQERHPKLISYHYDEEAEQERKNSALLASKVISALNKGNTQLAFQPVVSSNTGKIEFHEALIRLSTEDGILMPAADFVPVAEKLGLVRLVDHHALDAVLQTLCQHPTAHLSVNVSNDTACDPEWLAKLSAGLLRNPGQAERLIIEITESHVARNLEEAIHFVSTLKELGCRVAIDDFGSGFTSFSNLKHLPVDIIKIDGIFVEDLENSKENQCFIKSLVELASVFNAKTVVEWVTSDITAKLLHSWGVDYLQGYQFGEPKLHLPQSTCDRDPSAQTLLTG